MTHSPKSSSSLANIGTSQRQLLRQVEEVIQRIERSGQAAVPIHAMIDAIVHQLRAQLGIDGARLYERRGDDYVLTATFPGGQVVEEGLRVPRTYGPLELCLMQGVVYMDPDDPLLDAELERALGASDFAAIEIGSERYVVGFNVHPDHQEDIVYSLGVVRHAINQKIREQEMEAIFLQAKAIQASILPTSSPNFGVFDIAGRSHALESVGGDLFDYITIHDKIMGLAIADASGHGFPAALQVRDVYMGLRMGMARDLKIVRTVERLNQIIHQSTLTSRFVSMFYGELEVTGLFIFVNAGHPPPFHVAKDGTVTRLLSGGPILGPLKGATYDRGFIRLVPGDMLVIYTDGITETWGHDDLGGEAAELEEYGLERLQNVVRAHQGESAEHILDVIFADISRFSHDAAPDDDRTAMVVVFPEA